MRAFVVDAFGPPEAMRWTDHPVRPLGPSDVRVAVRACGVCRHDLLTRSGAFPSIDLPIVLGHQIAGVVDAVGPEVVDLQVGDRVLSLAYETCGVCPPCVEGRETWCRERPKFLGEDVDGGYAEYVVATERTWLPLPSALDFTTGATLTCTFGTAYHALVTRAQVQPGETVVVTGASGGVGRAALRVVRSLGARTIAVTSSADRGSELLAAGADDVVVTAGDYATDTKRLTGGVGADAVLDVVGGSSLLAAVHAVRPGGRVVVLGNVDGGSVALKPAQLILKEVALVGTKSVTRREMGQLLDRVVGGAIEPEPVLVRPFADAIAVHQEMAAGGGRRSVLAM